MTNCLICFWCDNGPFTVHYNQSHFYIDTFHLQVKSHKMGGCGSRLELVSCHQNVAGFDFWSACQRVFAQNTEPQAAPDVLSHLAWQPLPSVYDGMNYYKSLWTKGSAKCKTTLNSFNFNPLTG